MAIKGEELTGDESWQELKARAVMKYNEFRERRGDRDGGRNPIGEKDLALLGEANFLISLAEFGRARS